MAIIATMHNSHSNKTILEYMIQMLQSRTQTNKTPQNESPCYTTSNKFRGIQEMQETEEEEEKLRSPEETDVN
jgi:hypothetical protein